MSSLAAARADNFYYPPDFDGKKHKSINKYHNSHPLGDRAKKSSEGILVIRFEMPFKVICTNCNTYIAMGVRFNAEKKCIGNYHTTKIWEFKMKCNNCPQNLIIHTDPKSCQYLCIEGLHKKTEDFDPNDLHIIPIATEEERDKRKSDAMYNMEYLARDRDLLNDRKRHLETLIHTNASEDFFEANSLLRKRFREEKKVRLEEEKSQRVKIPNLVNSISKEDEESMKRLRPMLRSGKKYDSKSAASAIVRKTLQSKKKGG